MDDGLISRALAAWKTTDQAAADAEGLLRVQVLKYAEGISGPPSMDLLRRAEELRRASNEALLATVGLLRDKGSLCHDDEPHSGLVPL